MTYLGLPGGANVPNENLPRPPFEFRHPSVSLVIPTLNEAKNLPWVLRRIPSFVD